MHRVVVMRHQGDEASTRVGARQEVAADAQRELLQGVFSRPEKKWIGSGATKRKVMQTVYYFAQETQDGVVELRPLNARFLPQGDPLTLPLEEFAANYTPEPEVYAKQTLPALRAVTKNLAKGERLRSQGQPFGAEVAFKTALDMDTDNVRGNFGLGLTYLDQGKTEEATQVLKKLVRLEEAFHPDNKHMFNEFGIKLRKSGMYEQALSYYASAYKLAKDDEHLCYNIARTLYEKGDYAYGKKYIHKALALRADFPEALSLLQVLEKKETERE